MFIFLILLNFTLPLILLLIGLIFYKYSSKKINSYSGYRTSRAMKNIETWNEANKYSAKLLIKFSLILVFIATLTAFLVHKTYDGMAIAILISIILSIISIIITIILTEKHLKDMFGV